MASIFYSKHLFVTDLFRTGFTLNFINSELDNTNDGHGTIPAGDAALTFPGYVHLVGDWTTLDWQISYEFGPPAEITPETPKPGYDKEGKQDRRRKGHRTRPRSSWLDLATLAGQYDLHVWYQEPH